MVVFLVKFDSVVRSRERRNNTSTMMNDDTNRRDEEGDGGFFCRCPSGDGIERE